MSFFILSSLPVIASSKIITLKPVVKSDSVILQSVDTENTLLDRGALVTIHEMEEPDTESLFPEKSRNLAITHFTWGAEFGSSIDLTGHNHSTFDLDINFGFKNSFIKVVGVGAGIHRSIQSGDNYIPIFFVLRTPFTRKPSLLFMNLQAGYSFNTINNSPTFGDFIWALGLGVNLSQSRRAKSYMILSVGARYFNKNNKSLINLDTQYVIVAKLSFGINF